MKNQTTADALRERPVQTPVSTAQRGYACIGLYQPKNPINIGAVLRAAGCYNAKSIFFTGNRFKKVSTDTMKIYRHIPLIRVDDLQSVIPYDCVPVAVDLLPDAIPLQNYKHPRSAFYIFGPEDGTLGEKVLSFCRDKIYIPTTGCMNLAATVNVVLYDRLSKQLL